MCKRINFSPFCVSLTPKGALPSHAHTVTYTHNSEKHYGVELTESKVSGAGHHLHKYIIHFRVEPLVAVRFPLSGLKSTHFNVPDRRGLILQSVTVVSHYITTSVEFINLEKFNNLNVTSRNNTESTEYVETVCK